MKSRAAIQEAHELAVLRVGLAEHNRICGLNLTIVSRPDPPDAMLSDGSFTTWMELTDAFFSPEWARDLCSFASDKEHRPMARGLYIDMDGQLARTFCDALEHKASKLSYRPLIERYGPGILVVGLESPWLDDESIDAIDNEWLSRGKPKISATFSNVYIGYRNGSGNHAFAWPCS